MELSEEMSQNQISLTNHGTCAILDNFYLYGGAKLVKNSPRDERNHDVWKIHIATYSAERLKVEDFGTMPRTRHHPGLAYLDEHTLLMAGGQSDRPDNPYNDFWTFDISKLS